MKNKTLAVVNPVSAGKSTGKEWPKLESKIKKSGISFDSVYTQYPGHAIELTKDALKDGYERIICVGGDGTMNEVLNGFFIDGRPINNNAVLAVLSRGTGCDFIRTFNMSKDINVFIDLLKRNEHTYCDVGKVNYISYCGNTVDRYFLNVSDVGLGGETTYRVNKTSKALKGFLSFLIGALISILFYKNKTFDIRIDDSLFIKEKLNSIIIANGKYFGGGMEVAPNAKLNDGLFDIIILGNLNKLELITNFPLIYKGKHLQNPKVKQYRCKKIVIECDSKALLEVDGEQLGTVKAEFEILPLSIKVLI